MLVTAVAFSSGALWQRHAIYQRQLYASRQEATTAGASLAQLFFLDGWPGYPYFVDEHHGGLLGAIRTASWVIVAEDGTVITADGDLEPYFRTGAVRIKPMEHLPGDDGMTRLDLTGMHRIGRLDGRVATLAVTERAVDGQTFQALLVLRHPPRPDPDAPPGTRPPAPPRPPPGDQGHLVFAFVLVSPFEAEAAAAAVDRTLEIGVPIAAVLVACLTWVVAGRVLRPVEAIRAELADITSGDLDRRVPVPRSDDEIHRLAVTTNATLDRLALAAEQQRRFVADAAHELRSPLAGLRNELEVAAAHPDPASWPATAATALRSAKRLQTLTDDLLMLARAEHPATVPTGHLVDLGALVCEQVAEREYLDPTGPRFTADEPATPVEVLGEEPLLGRLLRNLLDNAAQHAERAVTVSLRPGRDSVTLEVTDDGPGIPAADRERVFGRFTRLDDDRSRDHGGAGLGLAIVAGVAARHGGQVHIADSERGARVIVRLPTTPTPGAGG
jgi:signal transduction histidine kinase